MLRKAVSTALRIGASVVLAVGISALGVTAATAQDNAHPIPQNYLWLYNFHSGKCVYVVGASTRNGAKLAQGTCKNERQFGFEEKTGFSGSEYFFQESVNLPSSGHHFLCVAVPSLSNDSTLIQEPCDYSNVPAKERFVFHLGPQVKGHTWWVIESVASSLCVDIAGGSKANGAAVQQQQCADVPNHSSWFEFVKPGSHLPCPCSLGSALAGAVRRSDAP